LVRKTTIARDVMLSIHPAERQKLSNPPEKDDAG